MNDSFFTAGDALDRDNEDRMNLHNLLKRFWNSEPVADGDDISELDLTFGETDADFENGSFLNSLEELTEDDIELSEHATRASRLPVSEMIRRIMFVFFLTMFLVSCLLLVQNMVAKYKGKQIYDRLEQEFFASGFDVNHMASLGADSPNAAVTEEGDVKQLAADHQQTATPSMTDALRADGTEQTGNVTSVAATDEDLDRLCCQMTLEIRGK